MPPFKHRLQWFRQLPFVDNLPVLTDRQWRVLGLAALAAVFGSYSVALLSLALPQIQTTFFLPAAQVSRLGALIRLGSLPAFGFALAADRLGRRRLFLLAVSAFALLTGATAFAPTPLVFVSLQFLVRMFISVTGVLAGVILAEELPADRRGWGMGVYAALASVGGGVAALCFALVNLMPFGWRGLYLGGWLALSCIGLWRAYLPETSRFQARSPQQAQDAGLRQALQPLLLLVHAYPGRFVALGATIFLVHLGGDAALFYDPAYLQQAHGWQPWQISLLNLSAGFMAVLGSISAGRLGDRWGRKKAAMIYLAAVPLLIIGYYHGWGWLLPLLWAAMLFATIGAGVTLSAIVNELFPTSYRSTAAGATAVVGTLGGVLSLTVHGLLLNVLNTPWSAVSLLASLLFLTPLLVLLLPETSGRTLEQIAPERE